jgi:hypothetical protein
MVNGFLRKLPTYFPIYFYFSISIRKCFITIIDHGVIQLI